MTVLAGDVGKLHLSIAALTFTVVSGLLYPWPGRRLNHIPAVGYKSQLLSFIGGFQWYYKAQKMVQEGCHRFGEGVFKVPNVMQWVVIVNGEKYIEEYRKAPENVLSFHDEVKEQLQIFFTLGSNIATDRYHIPIVRTLLTRNIPAILPSLHEEVVATFDAVIPVTNDWVKVKGLETMMQIVSRASNLVFVGAPLCRVEDYLQINIDFTVRIMVTASALALLPKFLRPLASRFSGIDAMIARCVKHLQPLIEERYQRMAEHGQDYPGKPNDLLSWLMDAASEEEATVHNLTRRMLTVNMAAIHTSSMTFSQALFDLATHPEFVQELRNEVESVVHCEGWTQAALNQMVKVDSFIRESQRLNTLGDLILGRVSRQPFTFSDGTVIPAGTFSYVAAGVAHTREETYKDAHTFRPFRFVEKREQTGRKVDMVSTHADFLSFGHGLHACPGRFFAAAELKLMLAHVVLTYDVKMAGDGERPKNMWYFTTCVPNPKAEVMFRKRAD